MKLRLRDRILWGLFISGEGAKACPSNKLWLWLPPQYSRKKYRLLVARLVRTGLVQQTVIEGKVNFRLTETGRKKLFASFPVLTVGGKTWDGFWRVAVFDIPESRRRVRDALRRKLTKLGFGRLQNSIYLSAYDWPETVLSKEVMLLEAKQKHLGDPKTLAKRIWPLNQLSAVYKQTVERLTTLLGIKEEGKREEFLKKLHRDFLETLAADPLLPPELLAADWPGNKARLFLLRAGAVRGTN